MCHNRKYETALYVYFPLSFEFLYEQNIPNNNMGLTCYKSVYLMITGAINPKKSVEGSCLINIFHMKQDYFSSNRAPFTNMA